jgi:hypothetical protein
MQCIIQQISTVAAWNESSNVIAIGGNALEQASAKTVEAPLELCKKGRASLSENPEARRVQ